jgi:hypothetical protein
LWLILVLQIVASGKYAYFVLIRPAFMDYLNIRYYYYFFGGFSISLRPQTITPAATDDFIFFLWWTAETDIAGTNTRLEVYLNGSLVCSWNRTALLPGVQNVWIQLACPDPFTLYANQPTEFMLRMFKVRLQHSHSLLVKYSIRIRHLPRTFGLRC